MRARLALLRHRREGDFSLDVVDALVKGGDVVADVGARWGIYAWLFSARVGDGGVVHAFEPNPVHTPALQALARHRRNIVVHATALSDADGTVELHVPVQNGRVLDGLASIATPEGGAYQTVTVRRRRLDDLALERLDFLKCDVEGHELSALRGAHDTLTRLRPVVLVEVEQRHEGADVAQTLAFFDSLGYEGFAVHEDGLRPASEFDLERDQIRPLAAAPSGGWAMPPDYVHDFVFAADRERVVTLLAPS